ncbi:hypothetical protein [Actinomadura sp. 6N118]|uniref:hypothetical protein n=1 Tax=Actinomadura sp. 6N118 TaxID=3375151 RepID=UPI0037B1ACFF
MALTITDHHITSDQIDDRAELRPTVTGDGSAAWGVHGPFTGPRASGRLFDRNAAITLMTLAETIARPPAADDRIWLHIAAWCQELRIAPITPEHLGL